MASWTEQDIARLRSNPHLWRKFEAHFGSLPDDFVKPAVRPIDLQRLQEKPDLAPKFKEAFGYLPEGFEEPEEIEEEPPPPPAAPLSQEQTETQQRAAKMWGRAGPGSQMPGLDGPDLVKVPQENLADDAQDKPLRKDGKPLFDGFFDAVKGVFTGPPAELDEGERARAEAEIFNMGYRTAGLDKVEGEIEEKKAEKRAAMGTGRVGYDIPEGTVEEDDEEDSIGRVLWQNVKTIPGVFKSTWAGFEAKYQADKKRHALAWHDQLAELAAREEKDLVNSSAVQAIAAQHGITEEDVLEDIFTAAASAAESEQEALEWHAKLREEQQKLMPKTREGSAKFYAGAILQAGLVMAPALAMGAITKNPNMTLGLMGTQVFGDAYAESRNNGRNHEQATWDGVFFAASEVVAERIPVGIILGGGAKKGFLKKILAAGATEGLEEQITEALNMGYEMGILDEDITLGEALVRLKHAGIIGAGMGAKLAIVMHPLAKDSADPSKLPPQMREAVAAHQQLADTLRRSLDPSEKVTRAELEEAKRRYDRVKQAAEEIDSNPEYARALEEAETELSSAQQKLASEKRRDEGLPGVAAKQVSEAEAAVKRAEARITSLLREGPEMLAAEQEAEKAAEKEKPAETKKAEPKEEAAEAPVSTAGAFALETLGRVGATAEISDKAEAELVERGLVKESTTGGLMVLPAGRRALSAWRDNRHENVINVGMDIGGKADALSPDRVREELAKIGVEVEAEERQRSTTENTMVASLSRELTPKELHNLSVALDQEAIAARFGDKGAMEGPNKEAWGEFDPGEFREPTSARPAKVKAQASKPAKVKAQPAKKSAEGRAEPASKPAKKADISAILRPEAVETLTERPTPTESDVAALQRELESDRQSFDLRTAELKALMGADIAPVTRQAAEAAVDARVAIRKEADAIERAEQENAAYARRERLRAKEKAKVAREAEEMVRGQKDAEADQAIALAEFLNKQEIEDTNPGVLASALKQAYANLSERESAARERLRNIKPIQGSLFDVGGALAEGSKLYKDLVEVGALKVAKGLVRFADWSVEMVADFGKRITPHLRSIYESSRVAADDAVKIAHRKFKSGPRKGQIVAAPPVAKTQRALSKLRNTLLKDLAEEGAPGRMWYERSGKGILQAVGGDVAEARLFAGLLAIYSARSALAPNTTIALKVWNQWKSGENIKGATGRADEVARNWLETGVEPTGMKRSNFYNNLMREIDPARYEFGQGATIDMWMMRAFGFDRDTPTDAQYVLSQTEIKRLAEKLGWEPQQAQAAIWVAIKARWDLIREAGRREALRKGYMKEVAGNGKAKKIVLAGDAKQQAANQRKVTKLFRDLALRVQQDEARKAITRSKSDYLDELRKHVGIVSWGSEPSTKLGRTFNSLSFAEKIEFQAEVERIMINPETGREYLAEWLGIIGNDAYHGFGAWDMSIGATRQTEVLIPPESGQTADRPTVEAGARRIMSAYSAMIGSLLELDSVSWHRPFYTAKKADSNAADVDLGRAPTAEEISAVHNSVHEALAEAFGLTHEQAIQYAPIPTLNGFRIMNFNEQAFVGKKTVPNVAEKGAPSFQSVVVDAINQVFPFDTINIELFRADGEVATNDWSKNPNGESYVSRIYQAKNPAVAEAFERAKRELAPKIESLRREFESRIKPPSHEGGVAASVSVDRILAGGADAVAETYGRFGQLTGRDTNAEQKIYDLSTLVENPDLVQAIADAYGYRVEFFSFESNPEKGVEFRLPQLKKKGYGDGYVWIYDPRNDHGSFKGAVEYTHAWRVSHEIGHGVTEQFVQAKYGDSKRYGRMGRTLEVDRGAEGRQVKVEERALTLKEAQRAVEWEDVTFRAQRMILEQMGVKVTDSQFAQEYNINMADAVYRVLTGDFGNPGDSGFVPSRTPANTKDVLALLQDAEAKLAEAQGREPTEGIDLSSWKQTTDAEIRDAVNARRQDGMGRPGIGIEGNLESPRVILGLSGTQLPRKPRNAVRFRKFRPTEVSKRGPKKLKVKPSRIAGDISTGSEFVVDVPMKMIYNATKDPQSLRGNLSQPEFEQAILDAGFAGFYQTDADGKSKGSVTLFERSLASGVQETMNKILKEEDGEGPSPVKSFLRQWANATQESTRELDNVGAMLVAIPGEGNSVSLSTVRPASKISVAAINNAMELADRYNIELSLSPVSLGKTTVEAVMNTREWTILEDAGFRRGVNGDFVRPAMRASLFSVRRGTNHGKGISLSEAGGIAQMMRNLFPRAHVGADIIAVESFEDLPPEIRRAAPDGFSKAKDVEAMFFDPGIMDRPQIILVSNNIASRGDGIIAAVHEIVGHYGVRSVLGAGYQNYMDSVWKQFQTDARTAAKRNGIKDVDHKDPILRQRARNMAAEEFIAYLAGEVASGAKVSPAKIGFWESIVRAVRLALQRFGLAKVDARDVVYLIESANRWAKGTGHHMREARREAMLTSQNVPLFYSQFLQYAQEKLPNAGTPAEYLQQLQAAMKKGQFKKAEWDLLQVEWLLGSKIPLGEIPVEMWHPDDLKRVGADSAKIIEQAAALGSMAQADVAQVTKLTKEGLMEVLRSRAVEADWDAVIRSDTVAMRLLEFVDTQTGRETSLNIEDPDAWPYVEENLGLNETQHQQLLALRIEHMRIMDAVRANYASMWDRMTGNLRVELFGHLPVPPAVLERLVPLFQSPNYTVGEIARTITMQHAEFLGIDPGLVFETYAQGRGRTKENGEREVIVLKSRPADIRLEDIGSDRSALNTLTAEVDGRQVWSMKYRNNLGREVTTAAVRRLVSLGHTDMGRPGGASLSSTYETYSIKGMSGYQEWLLVDNNQGVNRPYESGHWSKPNAAHMRGGYVKDAETGEWTFMVDEIQSDTGQRYQKNLKSRKAGASGRDQIGIAASRASSSMDRFHFSRRDAMTGDYGPLSGAGVAALMEQAEILSGYAAKVDENGNGPTMTKAESHAYREMDSLRAAFMGAYMGLVRMGATAVDGPHMARDRARGLGKKIEDLMRNPRVVVSGIAENFDLLTSMAKEGFGRLDSDSSSVKFDGALDVIEAFMRMRHFDGFPLFSGEQRALNLTEARIHIVAAMKAKQKEDLGSPDLAPAFWKTEQHQLAAIKKAVRIAVENGATHVAFAPGEVHAKRYGALKTLSAKKVEKSRIEIVENPYDDWALALAENQTGRKITPDSRIIPEPVSGAIAAMLYHYREVIGSPHFGGTMEERANYIRDQIGAALENDMEVAAPEKLWPPKRFLAITHPRDKFGQTTTHAAVPIGENGKPDMRALRSLIGTEGAMAVEQALPSMTIPGKPARFPRGSRYSINADSDQTGAMFDHFNANEEAIKAEINGYHDGFSMARGLMGAYNEMLPTVVKKFAKQFGAKVEERKITRGNSDQVSDNLRASAAERDAVFISQFGRFVPLYEDPRYANRPGAEVDGHVAQPETLEQKEALQRELMKEQLPKVLTLEINDALREAVETTGFTMFSVREDRVMGDTMEGTGLKFRDFFADVTRGKRQQPKGLENYAPAIATMPSTDTFAAIRQKYSGNFENHIMTSIPGYREAQDAIFVAITNALGEKGGAVLDIGASEGAALKAIVEVNPNISGVALDPNPEMRKTFREKGGPDGVEYALAAFGAQADAGKVAWTEDDGTEIPVYNPKGKKFDFAYEGMVFQFISNERKAQLKRAKELLKKDGVLVIQEKLGGPKARYDANERQKDAYKARYYSAEQIEAKRQEVLQTGGDAVEGMTDLQVSVDEMETVLKGLFGNVVQIWDSGNFKGYAASDDAAKIKSFVDNLQPLDSNYATVITPRAVKSHGGAPMMFSIRSGQTGNSQFDSFASKVGPFNVGTTLKQMWQGFTSRLRDRSIVATMDVFHGQKIAEEALGLSPDEMGYISMRLAAGSESVVRTALEYGVPIWREGATDVDVNAGGFLSILKPLAGNPDKLRAWELWMVANRAARLKGEGRELLFENAEIAEVIAEVDRQGWTNEFKDIAKNYAEWKSKLLDFAQEAGVINSQTRPLWEHADHIPFYRVLEGEVSGPFSGGAIADVKQQIQRLRGSDKNIGDPLQNIFMNIASLIDASMRNHAARLSIKNLDGSGLVTKHPQFEFTSAAVPLDQLRARLKAAGVNAGTLNAAGLRGIEVLTAIQAPTGQNVVSFFEDGKRQYYEVHDPLILTALRGVHPNPWAKMMAFLRVPKRFFTQAITLDPIFMGRNWFRDMWHSFALGRDGAIPIVPGYDSVRGAISSLAKDEKMVRMMAGGGAFDSGYVNAHDPSGMAKIIRGRLNAAGLVTNWTTQKPKAMYEFYRDLSSSIENSHRVMIYQKAVQAGKTHKEASYESRDIMDFSMRGAHPIIRFIAETVPFWNARLQGVYRTFRVAGPGAGRRAAALAVTGMVTRGALLTLASVALFFKNQDDDRWKELNDYEKNMYYHFFDVFEEGDHYALPKPFEIGAMFSTIPEIIAEGMMNEDPDAGKAAARQFYHMVAEALNFAPDVQAIMPIAELAMNRDTFRDSPILADWDRKLLPEDQDDYRISPFLRATAHAMPEGAPAALRSPKQLQHLVQGYTATLGMYAVGVADMIWWRLNEEEAGLPPEKRPDEIMGVRSFVRSQPRKYPKQLSTMYDVLEDADKVYNSMRRAEQEGLDDRAEKLERDNIELIIAREEMDSARNEIRDINKEIREIHIDPKMPPGEKRKLIDELLEERAAIARDVYDWRPGGKENVKEVKDFKRTVEGGDFTGMTRKEQLDTLQELGMPRTADLLREVSLSPREVGNLFSV